MKIWAECATKKFFNANAVMITAQAMGSQQSHTNQHNWAFLCFILYYFWAVSMEKSGKIIQPLIGH